MIGFVILGALTLLAAFLLLRLYAGTDKAKLNRATWRAALAFTIVGTALAVLRVPLGFMFLGVAALLPLTRPGAPAGPDLGRSSGKDSRVETKYLRMVLDHESGALDGLVLDGRHRDQRLTSLSLAQLLDVRADCLRDDPDGVPLIEAYLDRTHGAAWRAGEAGQQSSDKAGQRRPSARMSREEALEILGLGPTATEAEIREAYHELIMKLHPDHGGSDYLAAKINQARDVLLGA